jgi:hypothetical protein
MTQVGTSLTYNFSHMVMAEDPASATFTATLTDLVGNTKTVSIGTVTIDPVPLTLSNLTVTNGGSPAAGSPPRFSGVSGYNTVQVSFTSSKVLGSGLVAAITEGVPVPFTGDAGVGADGGTGTANGSLPLSCVASAGDAGATYICRYSVTGHETTPDGTPISTVAEETEQVVINAVDDVGNVATLGAPLVFDFQAPQLDQSTVAIDYIPAFPVNSVLQAVTAAGPNSTVVISASANEPLSGTSTPSVSLSPVPSAFPQFNSLPSANANSFTFEATIGTNTTGTYQVAITNLVDLVGNTTAAAQMNTALLIQNDSTTPPAGLDANNTITQVRAPWGSLSSFGMPYSALMGSPDTNNQSKTIAVFSGPGAPGSAPSESNPVAAQLVAIITANPDGSFGPFMSNGSTTYNLPPIDYPVLYVAAVNAAGVPSARQEVMSVSWYGNLWNSGSSTNNSTLVKVPSFSPTLVPNPQDAFPASAAQMAQLQPSGGTPSTIAAAGVWAQRAANASSPGARSGAAYAFDTRRGVGVLFGGTDGTSSFGDTWEWDGSAWTQKTVQGPSPRAGAAMAFDPLVGAVVLFGGFNGNSYLADTWQWDGSTWKNLTPTGLSPTARWNAAMTWDGSLGAVVLFGGDSGNQLNHDLMLWNGSAWSMALGCTGNVFPSARSLHTLSWLPQQNVLVVVGGRDGTGDQGDTWTCTGATASTWNKQVSLTNLPSREGAVAGVTPNGLIVFGGLSGTTALSDAWIWNGTGSSWTSLASAPAALSARTQAAGGWDSVRNELDVIGGTGGTGSYCKAGRHCADNWGFSPSTSTWADETPQPLPPALSGAAAAYDSAHGQTVIFGGLDANGNPSSQTLLWDGHHWLQPEPQTTPPARSGAAMAYDANAGVAVLFGGVDDTGTAMGDTWLWDGTNWSSGSGGTPPAARSGHVMVYDSRAQNVIMFGGSSGSSNLLDTEIWTPSGWQQEFPQQFPPLGRVQAGAAFDQGSSNTVVFGGELMAGSPLNTTYLWNGGAQTWTFDSGAVGGPLRSGQVMAYDSARNHVVLFGGMGSSGLMNDIWDLDDGSPDMWIPRTPVQAPGGAAPSPRMGAVGVFDSARNRFVVFGGTTSGGQVLGDVWELSNLPSTQPAEIASLTFAATGDLNNVAASGFGWQLSAFIGGTGANTNGAFAQAQRRPPRRRRRRRSRRVGTARAASSVRTGSSISPSFPRWRRARTMPSLQSSLWAMSKCWSGTPR